MPAAAGVRPAVPAASGRGPVLVPLTVLAVVLVVPIGLVVSLDRYGYDIWGAFIWGPVILLATLPLCRWVAARTGEPDVVRFMMGAALLKVVIGSVARYASAEAFYGGLADASRYDNAAAELAPKLRVFDFTDLGKISGTRFVEVLTGAVQAVIGETLLGTFFVFSLFGFAGLCLLYVAFCESLPGGDRVLHRRLLFLLPTMWYWPSSIGKEAFLLLCLGGAVYGTARVFAGHLGGLVPGLLGAWGLAVVRPHFVLILLVGIAAAVAFGDGTAAPTQRGRAFWARVAVVVVAVAALPAVLGAVERFFKIEGLNLESVAEVRDEVARRTEQGGSVFDPPDLTTPWGFGSGVVTVLFRPFPWEAGGAQLLTALEGVAIAVVAGFAIARRWPRWPRTLWLRWCRFALGYVLTFCWAFSVVGNFGILARQRSLMYPMLFVLLASCRPTSVDADVRPPGPPRLRSGGLRAGRGTEEAT